MVEIIVGTWQREIDMYQKLPATRHYLSICIIILCSVKRTRVTIMCIPQFEDPTFIKYYRLILPNVTLQK